MSCHATPSNIVRPVRWKARTQRPGWESRWGGEEVARTAGGASVSVSAAAGVQGDVHPAYAGKLIQRGAVGGRRAVGEPCLCPFFIVSTKAIFHCAMLCHFVSHIWLGFIWLFCCTGWWMNPELWPLVFSPCAEARVGGKVGARGSSQNGVGEGSKLYLCASDCGGHTGTGRCTPGLRRQGKPSKYTG